MITEVEKPFLYVYSIQLKIIFLKGSLDVSKGSDNLNEECFLPPERLLEIPLRFFSCKLWKRSKARQLQQGLQQLVYSARFK